MKVVIYCSEKFNMMDMVIPYEILRKLPQVDIKVVSDSKGLVTSSEGIAFEILHDLDQVAEADLLWVCSSKAEMPKVIDQEKSTCLTRLAKEAKLVIGIESGAYLLALAGLLVDRQATCHPSFFRRLKKLGAKNLKAPLCYDGNFITAASNSLVTKLVFESITMLYSEKLACEMMQYSQEFCKDALMKNNLPEKWTSFKQGLKRYDNYLLKESALSTRKVKQAKKIVYYLYQGVNAIDFVTSFTLVKLKKQAHIELVADTKGLVAVEGMGFNIKVDHAIQEIKHAYMLIIPSGYSLLNQLKNSYLLHWISSICPSTFRIIAIGEGEQVIGVSGVLTEFDPFTEEVDLYNSKYVMVPTFVKAQSVLLKMVQDKHHEVERILPYLGLYGH